MHVNTITTIQHKN